MATPDASLGLSVDFDADGFRQAIKFAMQMGTNPDPERAPIFIRKSTERTYWMAGATEPLEQPPRLDREGNPLDPNIEVRETPDERLIGIDCAIEVERADAEELPVGNFRPTKLIVTLLDQEYTQVEDCRELIYNGDRYLFGYEPEAPGLFSVGVYTRIFYALDES